MARCVYTALTGGNERLNEQPSRAQSALPFICLTDDPDLRSESWEVRYLAPIFAADPVRSQRAFKLLPHRYLPEFEASLYIDNSVRLKVSPERVFTVAAAGAGLSLPAHSFRASLLDEFLAVIEQKLDDPPRLAEQLAHYRESHEDRLAGPVSWNALLLRDHRDPRVIRAMEIWLAHLCRYSRRDQLSAPVAFHLAGLRPDLWAIDNYESWMHSWPYAPERSDERRLWGDDQNLRQQAERILALEAELAAAKAKFAAVSDSYETVLASRSWRLLAPARAIGRKLRQVSRR
jgi:hypothetical protein